MHGLLHRRMTYPQPSGSTSGHTEVEKKAESLLVSCGKSTCGFVEFLFVADFQEVSLKHFGSRGGVMHISVCRHYFLSR